MNPLVFIVWIVVLVFPSAAKSWDAATSPVLDPGGIRSRVMTGIGVLDRDPAFAGNVTFEIGVADGVELAAPLAVGVKVIETEPGSGIYLALGLTDLFIAKSGDIFYTPALALSGQARLGRESSRLIFGVIQYRRASAMRPPAPAAVPAANVPAPTTATGSADQEP